MTTDNWAGEFMGRLQKWLDRASHVENHEETDQLNQAFADKFMAGEFPGASLRFRRVKDIHPVTASPEDPFAAEVSIEFVEEKIRLSAFYGKGGEFIGWSYFDRGDIPIWEIRKHIGNWKRNIPRGRPKKDFNKALTDTEIYDLIASRDTWLSPLYDSASGRKSTIREAIEYIAFERIGDETENEELLTEIQRAYEREYRRRRK